MLLLFLSIFCGIVQMFRECCEPIIPDGSFDNTELYQKDILDGVSYEERIKNAKNGKYKLTEQCRKPHRDPKSGKIIIENCELYYKDVDKYGAWQAQQWVARGKYNLN